MITSLPGIGFRLGAEFLAVVGDPALLESPDQLAAWAGLAPVAKDSGKRTGGCTPQALQSSTAPRHVHVRADRDPLRPRIKAYYQRKRDQGKRPIPATIALARRRVNVLYALIRDSRTWQPNTPQITTAAA